MYFGPINNPPPPKNLLLQIFFQFYFYSKKILNLKLPVCSPTPVDFVEREVHCHFNYLDGVFSCGN